MLTANRVHCADGGDAGDPEALRATAKQIVDSVGMALSYRCRGDATKLPLILATTPVQMLFRVGHSLTLKLQRELRARIDARDSGLKGNGVLRLDSPLREAAAGLLRPRPLLYGGLLDEKRADFRPPSSLVELAALSRAVSEIGFRAFVTGPKLLGASDDALQKLGFADPALQPTHGALVGAHLAHALLARPTELAPLNPADLAPLRKTLDDKSARAQAVDSFVDAVRALAPLPGAPTPDEAAQRARTYAGQVLDAMSAELAQIAGDPDPRFVSTVWTRISSSSSSD
jgi:hypothetical protein